MKKRKGKNRPMDEEKLAVTTHLEELRKRLTISLIAVVVGFVVSYSFAEQIFKFLMNPLLSVMPQNSSLIFTNLTEAFFTYLKTSILSGIFIGSPVIFYQMWKFISPGLYKHEKSYCVPFVIFSTLFFIAGASFGYFIVFPFGFKFFLGFETNFIKALPSIKEYFSFCSKLLLSFGIIFELPLIIFFLAKIGLVTSDLLTKNRKYAVLLIFVVAAVITPPDVITQIMMAGPLIILYEISIIVARIFGKKKK